MQGAIHFRSISADQAESEVWLKVIRKQDVLTSEWDLAVDEFEIHRTVSGLQHVIPLLLSERDDELIALAMPRAREGDLWGKIQYGGLTLSENEAKRFASQLVRGVAELHQMRIVHGDVKPQNILLLPQGDKLSVALCDFGLSKRLPSEPGRKITFSEIRGTQGYISPEICAEQDYDEKVDVFAVGIVLFRLVAGTEPFYPVENFAEEVEFADDCCSHLTKECKDFLQSLLHIDPERRLSAEEALQHAWLKYEPLEQEVDAENELGLRFFHQSELEQPAKQVQYVTKEPPLVARKVERKLSLNSLASTMCPDTESDECSVQCTEDTSDECSVQ